MNADQVKLAINRQISALYQQRHPSKGVVVEVPDFDEKLARFQTVRDKVSDHKLLMVDILKKAHKRSQNGKRWRYIRRDWEAQAYVASLAVIWQDDQPIGFSVTDSNGPEDYYVSDGDAQEVLRDLKHETRTGYVVFHDKFLMADNFSKMGLKLPDFANTIDTAQVGGVIAPFGAAGTPSSVEIGRMMGVERSLYGPQSEFLYDVFKAMVAKEDLFKSDIYK